MVDYLSVGYVLKPQGIRGEIKVESLTDDLERFNELDLLYIENQGEYNPLKITARRYSGQHIYLCLEGYNNMDEAENLRGEYLWIPREMARVLPEDSFFVADIIGCDVYTTEDEYLGSIDDIIHTGSNDVYVTRGPKGEILIPALKKTIIGVDIEGKRIAVNPDELEGLWPHGN